MRPSKITADILQRLITNTKPNGGFIGTTPRPDSPPLRIVSRDDGYEGIDRVNNNPVYSKEHISLCIC